MFWSTPSRIVNRDKLEPVQCIEETWSTKYRHFTPIILFENLKYLPNSVCMIRNRVKTRVFSGNIYSQSRKWKLILPLNRWEDFSLNISESISRLSLLISPSPTLLNEVRRHKKIPIVTEYRSNQKDGGTTEIELSLSTQSPPSTSRIDFVSGKTTRIPKR